MSLPKQKLREIIFHLLFSEDFEPVKEDNVFFLMEHHKTTKKHLLIAHTTACLIKDKLPDIDAVIEKYAVGYEFNRIASVEKNILRLGVFEMTYNDQIPGKVAIAEAMRLARKFATSEGAGFVNGVLDAIYQASSTSNET